MEQGIEFFASILDGLTEHVVVLDPGNLIILYANRSFLDFHGLSLDRARGLHCFTVTHGRKTPCHEPGADCPVQSLLTTGCASSALHVHADKNGTRNFFRLTASPIRNRDGQITHVIETTSQVTDQLRLEEELRRKSELFEKILSTSPDGIIGNDKKGNIFLFNAGAEQIYGYSREEVIGKVHVSALYPPGAAREVKDFIYSEHYGGRGQLQDFETEVLAKDGRRIPIRISCALLYDKGVETGTIGFFHDISARKALRELLSESEESFRSIFESAKDAIITIGEDRNILKTNQAAEEMLGYGKGELIGVNIFEVFPGEYMDQWDRIRTHASSEGSEINTKHVELSTLRKSGEVIPVHVSLSVSKTRTKSIITAILRDISERKAFEEELRLLSITDPLTKLFNRRHFLSLAQMEMGRATRTKIPFSVLLIDLDRFKSYNDNYGHAEGDRLLTAVAEETRKVFRSMDSGFRFGGEEFVILLPDTTSVGAMTAAERFRIGLSDKKFAPVPGGLPTKVTASIGVAEYREGYTPDDLVRYADLAMYAAKNNGRNRTIRYDELLASSSISVDVD